MKNSTQLLPEGEAESIKTDALFSWRSNTTYSHILKPLINGCVTGQLHALFKYSNVLIDALVAELVDDPNLNKRLHDIKMANMKQLRLGLLCGVTYTTASLGAFEILTQKLRTTNHGRPVSLYQEACCGFTSGATAAFVWQPFMFASSRTAAQNFSYRTLFSTVCQIVRDEGVLALWKGSGSYIGTLTAANVGMLASYNRSLNYLMESKGLSKWNAVISASIISGFFAAACSHPCIYLKAVKDTVKKKYHGGEKHAYRHIPLYITRILTPHSGFKFYIGFLNNFQRWAVFCMVQWYIFEHIRTVEEYMDHSTPDCQPSNLGKQQPIGDF
ncbi:hypothetical protein Pfo_007569 [Paulownia fortunei]|nr:hypothetical protein Pfo_007569 [Paulownia fortunei]